MYKKKIIYVAIIACIFSFSAIAYADTSVNLIQNPSLETPSPASSSTPNYWNWDFFGNSKPTFTYPVPGYLGGNAAKITMASRANGDAKWFFDPVVGFAEHQYAFSDYYMSTVNTKVTVQYTMADGTFQYQNIGGTNNNGVAKSSPNSWTEFTATFVAPANAVKVSVFHRIQKNGTLTVDNFSLTDSSQIIVQPPATDPGPNLILNPTLQSQTNGTPDNWFTDVEGNTVATFQYPVSGYDGSNAAQTNVTASDPNGGDAKWIWQPVSVDANGDYQFSEYYMSNATTVVIVDFNMADGTRQFTNLVILPPAATWTKVTKEFNVRPGTASVTVFDVLRAVGTLTVGNVSLSKLPDGTFPEGIVSLSFDDDNSSFYTNALPLLLSHNFLASENIVNDWIGTPSHMTTSQISEINKDGMEIGSHSLSHPFLTGLSESDATNEIANSKNIFLGMGFTPVSVFVYPYGDVNDSVESIVKNSGYIAGRGTDQGFNTKNSDLYDLRTENVEASTTLAEVKTWIDAATQNHTWLILGFHDISNTPIDEYTTNVPNFQAILDYLAQTKVKVATTDYVVSNMIK